MLVIKQTRLLSDMPVNVRKLGGFWYKKRKFFPGFVPFLGKIWYKKRKYRSRGLSARKDISIDDAYDRA